MTELDAFQALGLPPVDLFQGKKDGRFLLSEVLLFSSPVRILTYQPPCTHPNLDSSKGFHS